MKQLQQLEQKIRNAIPFLKEEFEAFEDGSIDRDMITQIGLNHVLEYLDLMNCSHDSFIVIGENLVFGRLNNGCIAINTETPFWNLKSAYLKDQLEGLINFLNDLKQ